MVWDASTPQAGAIHCAPTPHCALLKCIDRKGRRGYSAHGDGCKLYPYISFCGYYIRLWVGVRDKTWTLGTVTCGYACCTGSGCAELHGILSYTEIFHSDIKVIGDK